MAILREWSFPDIPVVKNPPPNTGVARDAGRELGGGRSPRRRKWQTTPVFLLQKNSLDGGLPQTFEVNSQFIEPGMIR